MDALGDLLDELRAEGREIVGPPAGEEPTVDDDLLVDPGAAGVPDIRLQARRNLRGSSTSSRTSHRVGPRERVAPTLRCDT
jgi:hypothetical protein